MRTLTNREWNRYAEKGQISIGLKGYCTCKYGRLKKLFGDPVKVPTSDGKVEFSWYLLLNEGESYAPRVISIYVYKETSAYYSDLPSMKQFITKAKRIPVEWHIGAMDHKDVKEFAKKSKLKIALTD